MVAIVGRHSMWARNDVSVWRLQDDKRPLQNNRGEGREFDEETFVITAYHFYIQ